MSDRFWLKLTKRNIIVNMELLALHPKDTRANRLLKELNHCLKHIETTEAQHVAIYGKRKNNKYKENSFINGLNHAKNLFEDDIIKARIQAEVDKYKLIN